jgi:anti-anti-sigma factor
MDLTTTARRDGGTLHLVLSGDLDLATAPSLHSAAVGQLAQHDIEAIAVDATGLTSWDHTGLGVLAGLRQRVRSFSVVPPDLLADDSGTR